MFLDCKKIKGGQGTTYDANHTDAAYARVDGGNRVTSKNKDNIGVNDGTASFDPSTLTLTLNNVYVYADRDDGILSGTASMEGMPDFKIVCNGTNEVESTDFVGLTQYGGSCTVKGGKLILYAPSDAGIFLAADTKLTLQDTDVETSSAYKPIGGVGKDKNCKVEVNNSRLRAETVNGSVNPVTGLTSFDLVDCNYADNGNWRSCASK